MIVNSQEPLGPVELKMLGDILDEVCLEKQISPGDRVADKFAAEVLEWFKFGITDRADLLAIIRPL